MRTNLLRKNARLAGWVALAASAAMAAGCAHGPARPPQKPIASAEASPEARVTSIIAQADARLHLGLDRIREGHLNQARLEFDGAVEVYLSAPGGAYADPRLSEAYRRTLETIHVLELEALAAGDGFTEAPSEPAPVDEMADLAVEAAVPSEGARERARQTVAGERNDFPVILNDAVLACIDLYQGPLREWFTSALARGGRYLPHIREVMAAEGLPQDLAYVALVESAFRPSAFSRAKARGVWQFIPATGRRFGLQQDWWVDERSDPDKATHAAARYLKQLHGLFGDWNLALAGYNAGERKILRALEQHGTGDFWSLCRTSSLKRETKNYVPMIHAAIIVAKAPEKYGLTIAPEPVPESEAVAVPSASDLRVIAECAGSSLDEIRAFNPELRRLVTPAARSFDVRVPRGQGLTVLSCLKSLPPEKRVSFRTHVVARRETLASIARQHGARVSDIAEANGISARKRLAVGTTLIIPTKTHGSPPSRPPARETSAARGRAEDDRPQRYLVQPGDTLVAIAARYGTTVRALREWNDLKDSRIAAGSELVVFASPRF
jgi:membrane-bound lytic murein transglycosylase D